MLGHLPTDRRPGLADLLPYDAGISEADAVEAAPSLPFCRELPRSAVEGGKGGLAPPFSADPPLTVPISVLVS